MNPQFRDYIGIGSNLGDRRANLQAAYRALGSLGCVVGQSSIYETAPVGITDQPRFLNMVMAVETPLTPHEVLRRLLAIELACGRNRTTSVPQGPRTLDLDLLLVLRNGEVFACDEPGLTLPHPRLAQRRFVLQPLAEIAPDLRWNGTRVDTMLAALDDAADGANHPDAVLNLGPLGLRVRGEV